jgi:3,5-epimerase/4-reductase
MTPQHVFIFGQGQLGTYYRIFFEERGVRVTSPKLDIRNEDEVRNALESASPDLAINCAAQTNIDWCEQNQLECFDTNTLGADVVGKVCQETGTYLLHLSSGCVQESKTADEVWTEEDPVGPLCFYSWTKVWAENLLMDRARKHGLRVLLLRPRQLLSAMVSPRNAITKLLTYNKFIDTPNSCTIVEDLMWVTEELVHQNATGVYNVVNPGVTTPLTIAGLLKEIVKPEMEFEKISKETLNAMTLAERVDAVISTAKLNALGIELPEIHERLREILVQFKERFEDPSSRAVFEQTQKETVEKLSLKF